MEPNNDALFDELRKIMDGAKAALASDQEESLVLMAKTCEYAWSAHTDDPINSEHTLFVAYNANDEDEEDPNAVTLDPHNLADLEDKTNVAKLAVRRAMGSPNLGMFLMGLTDLTATIAMEYNMEALVSIARVHLDYGTFSVYVTGGGVLLCRHHADADTIQTLWCEWEDGYTLNLPDDLTDDEHKVADSAARGFTLPKLLAKTFERSFPLMGMEATANIKAKVEGMLREDDDN